MKVVNLLLNHSTSIDQELIQFIEKYNASSLPEKRLRSESFSEHMETFFSLQKIILDHALKINESYQSSVMAFRSKFEELEEVYSRLIMLHLDEPDQSYLGKIKELERVFAFYTSPEYESVLCAIQSELTDEDEEKILKQSTLTQSAKL
jgi:hypothetical protein